MWTKIYIFIGLCGSLFFHTVVCDSEDFVCDSPWQKLYRGCYMFVKQTFYNWTEARNYCVTKGGDLFAVINAKELSKVGPKIRQQITNMNLLEWWIGLRHQSDYQVWKWIDNLTLDTTAIPWARGHPKSNDCAVIDYQDKIKDLNCSEVKPFVCEIDKTGSSTAPISETTTLVSSRVTTPSPTAKPTTVTTATSATTQSPSSTSGRTVPSSITTKRPTNTTQVTTQTSQETTMQSSSQTPTTTVREVTTKSTSAASTETTTRDITPTKSTYITNTTTVSTVTVTSTVTTTTTEVTTTKPELDSNDFIGCYSVNQEVTCPPLKALGLSWPRTEAGNIANVTCRQGKFATWRCQAHPVVCWIGEPDVTRCTSEAIQDLTNQADEILKSENNSAATIAFMESLANTVSVTPSEQDLYQSAKLMSTASKANPANEQAAKDIVSNALKCGNNIISSTKDTKNVEPEVQTMIASSLLSAMESITTNMMKSINTTTRIQQPNMEVELQVVDLHENIHSVKYEGKSNTNTFSIPIETLRDYTQEGPVKVAFIQYNSINELLKPAKNKEDRVDKLVISDVISASIGQSNNQSDSELHVAQPVRFNFETGHRGGKEGSNKLCSFWNFSLGHTGAWSQKGCELVASLNATHTTCKCYHMTNFAILMDIHSTAIPTVHSTSLTYITYVGCIISIICLFLSLVTFTCLSSVQGERNSVHKNLVFCLLVAEVFFLAGVERTENKLACSIIAGFLHFFFLASFSWMFVEGIHILLMLVQVFDSAKSRLKYYYLVGYGCPLIIVGVSAIVYHEGYGTDSYCWLTSERLFIWSFAGPVAFILLVNLIILIYAMSSVCKHSEYVFTKEKSRIGSMKGWIQGALALEVLLGLTWVLGYFYISEEALPVAYLFTIFNSLQGVFIFVFHCLMNKKVRKEYKRFIDYKSHTRTTLTTSKSANGTGGQGTGSTGTQMHTSRKKSDFSNINFDRHGSSSA